MSSVSVSHTDTENDGKPSSKAAATREVFEFWQAEMNHPKAQLTADRKKKIEERLADSTVDEIKTAIRGCKRSDFHMGREPGKPDVFDDIELICRKRSHLEKFIAKVPISANGATKKVESPEDKAIRESCTWCFGTGTERTEKGARVCKHERSSNEADGVIRASSAGLESVSKGGERRVS